MAETNSLLNCRTGQLVPGVRIPLSPLKKVIFSKAILTGYSAVRLAHLVWDQGVAGSNPATPTKIEVQKKVP